MLDDLGRVLARHRQVAAAEAAHRAQQRLAGEVLREVAGGAVAHRLEQVAPIRRHGEHHDPGVGQPRRELAHRLDAAHAGQVDVEQQQVRPQLRRQLDRLLGVARLPHHFDVGGIQRLADGGSDERVVIDQQDAERRLILHPVPPLPAAAAPPPRGCRRAAAS